jgi:hypothetical protein
MDFRKLDLLTSSLTSFATFTALVNAEGGYRPTIRISGPQTTTLADAYDLYQFARGDARRAVRDVLRDIRRPAAPRKPAAPRGPSKAQIARVIATLSADPRVAEVSWVDSWDEPAFDIQYRYPWVSGSTSTGFDAEPTVQGALDAVAHLYSDPTANGEWDDAPDEAQA